MPTDSIELLRRVSSGADVLVDFPVREDQRINLAVAVSWADRVERDDEAYIAEMNRWVHDPDVHAISDGVPLEAIPHVPADQPRHTDVPPRDFEVGVTGRQLIERDVDERPLIAVAITDSDTAADHLRAGEAMMRLMIQAEPLGLATCPLGQAVDFAAFRTRVQGLMGWIGYPQIMLRIGYPPDSTVELPPRRAAIRSRARGGRSAASGMKVLVAENVGEPAVELLRAAGLEVEIGTSWGRNGASSVASPTSTAS